MGNAAAFLSKSQKKQVTDAIESAEKQTSGEIVIHIDDKCNEEVLDRAAYIFEFLDLHKTKNRNAVLFYISYSDHKFAILGDVGINQKVPEGFWDKTRDIVIEHFKKEQYTEGLVKGIAEAGKQLGTYFPYTDDTQEEISNEISFGNDENKSNEQ